MLESDRKLWLSIANILGMFDRTMRRMELTVGVDEPMVIKTEEYAFKVDHSILSNKDLYSGETNNETYRLLPKAGQLWIVGCVPDFTKPREWTFLGVFASEDEAAASCHSSHHFIGPVQLGVRLKDTLEHWEAYYPIAAGDSDPIPWWPEDFLAAESPEKEAP